MNKFKKLAIPALGAGLVVVALFAAVALVELINYMPAMALIVMVATLVIVTRK